MKIKMCTKCHKRRKIEEYSKDSYQSSGLHPSCKICQRKIRGSVKRPTKEIIKKDIIFRRCGSCKKYKRRSEFYSNLATNDGIHHQCKVCSLKNSSSEASRIGKFGRRQKERQKVLDAYGCKCICCGEDIREFMCIDHINGGGRKHRKEIGNIYRWLIKNNFPKGFQILCHNCNMAKGFYGKCPHEKNTNRTSK